MSIYSMIHSQCNNKEQKSDVLFYPIKQPVYPINRYNYLTK